MLVKNNSIAVIFKREINKRKKEEFCLTSIGVHFLEARSLSDSTTAVFKHFGIFYDYWLADSTKIELCFFLISN